MSTQPDGSRTGDFPLGEDAVRDRLDNVYDPELDRSIVELDYIDDVEIDDGEVTVRFTLPTAWCSPAFAWMMASDAREEVESLSGVDRAQVSLQHHLHMEEINRGVNEGLAFDEALDEAEDDPAEVRATLDHKARLSRQYAAVEALLDAGLDGEQIVALTTEDVDIDGDLALVYVRDRSVGVTVDRDPLVDYIEKARETGLVADGTDPLFATPEGDPVDPDEFDHVHRQTRLAKTNMSGQGGICEALQESRQAGLEADDTDWGITESRE